MVNRRYLAASLGTCAIAADARTATAQEQAPLALDPLVRARLMMALLAVVLLALLMFVIIRLGAFSVRRKLRMSRGPSRIGPKYWAARRWVPRAPADEPPRGDPPRHDGGQTPCP